MSVRAGAGSDPDDQVSEIEERIRALEAGGSGGAELGSAGPSNEVDVSGDTDPHDLLVLPDISIDGPIEIVAAGVLSGSAASGNLYIYPHFRVGPTNTTENRPITLPPDVQSATDPTAQHHLLLVERFDPVYWGLEAGTYEIAVALSLGSAGDGVATSSISMWAKAL